MPDGRPVSVTVVFEIEQITLSGAVPSDVVAERLVADVLDYSGTALTIVNDLTIDPDVSDSGGVRFVELDAVGFREDSAVIFPDHAEELDRIVAVMNEFPGSLVHVVGNSDDPGGATRNFVISQRRAEAVVEYLSSEGIDRSRFTTQPAGASNPVSIESTEAARSLNRRTEFVIYGLFG